MTLKELITALLEGEDLRVTENSRVFARRSDGEFAELEMGDIAVADAETSGKYDIVFIPTGKEGPRTVSGGEK